MTDNFIKAFCYMDNSKTPVEYTYCSGSIRISVLTPYLIRVEQQKDCLFLDGTTQRVINRNFSNPEFNITESENIIYIKTDKTEFYYNTSENKMDAVMLHDGRIVTDYKKGNLKGTCRTLDQSIGKVHLDDGIISLNGVAVFDDSDSLLIDSDGYAVKRENKEKDIYYFAYGFEYKQAVKDFLSLSGRPPLIPRFALGNWWSRYKAYTQDEYISLIKKFKDKKIPLTVATIDMDWHWVDVIRRFGLDVIKEKRQNPLEYLYLFISPGWTGYSWNTELFPDHKAMLKWLKEQGLKVTLNIHPASGCKFYEDKYPEFCDFMGIDKSTGENIKFDITDKKFIDGYFRFLHHPHEDDGVDFWWIDWQQGKNSGIKGLDPLWALNHYHSIDSSRDGKRPLILSRFAGAGSQRYPLGFSGDTNQNWACLDFQPYFTSTASNIGYTWWSHDIGGHLGGNHNDELYIRWVQFGVFSPVMRLHSTNNEFMGKEPWKYNKFAENTVSDFMRLRHKLIPYIYSMNYLTAFEGRALIEPMYYEHPRDERAYKAPNEYYFGTELIVCPVTSACNKKTGLAGTAAYLPKGRYTDIFTKRIYMGNTLTELYRDQSSIPVLAKAGAIIPMNRDCISNSCKNPEEMDILIYRGNNSFTLYEDDGETLDYIDGKSAVTEFIISENNKNVDFAIKKACGDLSVIPGSRSYTLIFDDITDCDKWTVSVNGKEYDCDFSKENNCVKITLDGIKPEDEVFVCLKNIQVLKNQDKRELRAELISKMQGDNLRKAIRYTGFIKNGKNTVIQNILKKPLAEIDELL